jgi:outer membrane receptor protein involved in Fe transport
MYDHGYVMNQAQPFDGLQFSARIDQVFRSGGDRLYVMYERIHQTLGDLTDRPALGSTTPSTNRYGSVNWIHVFSPKLLNEIHVGNVRTISGQTLSDATIAGSIPYGMIGIDTTDGYQFWNLFGGEAFAPDTQREHTYNLRDTVSYSWRNHTIRGGYQFAREDYIIDDELFGRGGFGFNFGPDAFTLMSNQYNFSSYLWSISGLTGSYSPQIYGATSKFNGIWADDSWKVRPNLTVTAGIRYDVWEPRTLLEFEPVLSLVPRRRKYLLSAGIEYDGACFAERIYAISEYELPAPCRLRLYPVQNQGIDYSRRIWLV